MESEVGESHHSSRSKLNKTYADRETYKRVRTERSPEPTHRTTTTKKSRSIELGPFMKWIQEVASNTSLKIPQFVLYNGQSRPLEHICIYKSTMGLVTNDEALLCKTFLSTLCDKALTWFTSLKPKSIDSWSIMEK